jgi:hypothetical protein
MHFIVSHQLTADFALRSLDVWPPLTPSAAYISVDWHALLACRCAHPPPPLPSLFSLFTCTRTGKLAP